MYPQNTDLLRIQAKAYTSHTIDQGARGMGGEQNGCERLKWTQAVCFGLAACRELSLASATLSLWPSTKKTTM